MVSRGWAVVGLMGCFLRGGTIAVLLLMLVLTNKLFSCVGVKGLRSTPFAVGRTLMLAPCPKTSPSRMRSRMASILRRSVRSLNRLCCLGARGQAKLSGVAICMGGRVQTSRVRRL